MREVFAAPRAEARQSALTLLVRWRDRSPAAASALAAEIRALDPSLPRPEVRSFADEIGRSLLPQRVAAIVTAILGIGGLALAAIGLQGGVFRSLDRDAP